MISPVPPFLWSRTKPPVAGLRWILLVLVVLILRLPGADTPSRDLTGHAFDPLDHAPAGTVILLFMATDCPISNRYAPVVNDLVKVFASPTLRFFAVYPDPATTPAAIRKHQWDYGYTLPTLMDPEHTLVRRAGATVTPEVAVFSISAEAGKSPRLVYRGRIDNRHEDIGRSRPNATQDDLREVLKAIVNGTPLELHTTRAVGCYIE
ncbi:redoxin domain-containing protein [Oleiharenicola lentus]|nr:redoxin domain-containing protein [Oleiharenicola lentus]